MITVDSGVHLKCAHRGSLPTESGMSDGNSRTINVDPNSLYGSCRQGTFAVTL